jgi:hypothetical protein
VAVKWVLMLFGSQLDQYMALSKKDLSINITLNELYNTHSLLTQHIEVLVSVSDLAIYHANICVAVSER